MWTQENPDGSGNGKQCVEKFVDEKSLDEAEEQFDVLREPHFLHSVSGETKFAEPQRNCRRRN